MTEQVPLDPNVGAAQNEQCYAAYDLQLAALSERLPEVEADRELIREGVRHLIDEFGIHEEMVANAPRALFLSALGQRYGRLEQGREGYTSDAYESEKAFIYNATAMLARDKSDRYPDYKDLLEANDEPEGEAKAEIYNRYTNTELTRSLKQLLADDGNELLAPTREAMGITKENETPYDVVVLDVANNDHMTFVGLEPENTDPDSDLPFMERYEQDERNKAEYIQWADALKQNGVDFLREMGGEQLTTAWKTEINGKNVLVLPSPYAQKVLYPEKCNSRYGVFEQGRDRVTVRHEYAHTQGGVNVDDDVLYGIAMEERRAVLFSGVGMGYEAVRDAGYFIGAVTGFSIEGYMNSNLKGGTTGDFFEAFAKHNGLQAGLELAVTAPAEYVSDSRPLQKRVTEYLGGFDGLAKRLHERAVQSGDGQAESRLREYVGKILKTSDPNGFFDAQRRRLPYTYGVLKPILDELTSNPKG